MRLRADSLLRELAEASASAPQRFERYRAEALRLIAQEQLIAPAFCCRIVELSRPPSDFLAAGGEVLEAPRLLPTAGELTALACGVATIGSDLEQKVTSLFAARQRSLALALDQLGNRVLHAVSRRLQDSMWVMARRSRLTLSGELRPGDPGLGLDAQGPLLRLAGADSIGVQITIGHSLRPTKSVSVVLGAGVGLPQANWSRCDDCRSRATCALVKASDAPALV